MFSIRLGIPEMAELWADLCFKAEAGSLTKDEDRLYKVGQGHGPAFERPATSRPSHARDRGSDPLYGEKVWQSYLDRNPQAARMYWVHGPHKGEITVIVHTQIRGISAA